MKNMKIKRFLFSIVGFAMAIASYGQVPDTVNIGTGANTGDGDNLRGAMIKLNTNDQFLGSKAADLSDTAVAIYDSLALHLDTLQSHNTRLNSLEGSSSDVSGVAGNGLTYENDSLNLGGPIYEDVDFSIIDYNFTFEGDLVRTYIGSDAFYANASTTGSIRSSVGVSPFTDSTEAYIRVELPAPSYERTDITVDNTNGIVVRDEINSVGILYDTDNSTAGLLLDRWIPDIAAVRGEISDSIAGLSGGHDEVTLAGTPNYITLAGQVITRSLINLASHVTGLLDSANINMAQLDAKYVIAADSQVVVYTDGIVATENIAGDTVFITWDSTAVYQAIADAEGEIALSDSLVVFTTPNQLSDSIQNKISEGDIQDSVSISSIAHMLTDSTITVLGSSGRGVASDTTQMEAGLIIGVFPNLTNDTLVFTSVAPIVLGTDVTIDYKVYVSDTLNAVNPDSLTSTLTVSDTAVVGKIGGASMGGNVTKVAPDQYLWVKIEGVTEGSKPNLFNLAGCFWRIRGE